MLPCMRRARQVSGPGSTCTQVQHHVGHLEVAGERAVYLLLLHAYLDPDAFIQSSSLKLNDAQPNAAKTAQGATDPSQQSRGGTASACLMTPEARGMAFMDTASHLGQQVEAQPAPATLAKPASVNLGRVLCDKFALDRDVRAACSVGFIALDAAQGDYLAAMLGAEEPFGVSSRRDASGAGPLNGADLQNELWPSLNGDAGVQQKRASCGVQLLCSFVQFSAGDLCNLVCAPHSTTPPVPGNKRCGVSFHRRCWPSGCLQDICCAGRTAALRRGLCRGVPERVRQRLRKSVACEECDAQTSQNLPRLAQLALSSITRVFRHVRLCTRRLCWRVR